MDVELRLGLLTVCIHTTTASPQTKLGITQGRNRPPFMTTSRSKIHQELNKNKHETTTRGYSEILGAE